MPGEVGGAAPPGCVVGFWERAEWARKAARKFAKKGRLVVGIVFGCVGFLKQVVLLVVVTMALQGERSGGDGGVCNSQDECVARPCQSSTVRGD